MSLRGKISRAAGGIFLLFTACLGFHAQESRVPDSGSQGVQTFPLSGTQDLEERNVKVEAVEYKGRKAVRVTPPAPPSQGLALLRGTEFADGAIEADVAVKVTTPPEIRNPGFIGIAFRARQDGRHYEQFFLRPGNSGSADQVQRNHSVQYASKPDFDFFKLRRPWPSVYEAYADLQLETWTRIKIEVQGRVAKLYVNGAANPVLVVDGLKGEDLKGGVGLWAGAGQESYFSNVRITHAKRQPIENGGEAGGTWEVKYASDSGNFSGRLRLHRDGATVSGTASGLLGSDVPVAGTWRNGYLELTFRGTWSGPGGDPGAATASLAGWVDGRAAKGRVSISGRADGVWTATRKE
jgi:hypothetical protein